MELRAQEGHCEEASPASHEHYIPCNRPATRLIRTLDQGLPLRMCDMCADHSVNNRGMTDVGPYTGPTSVIHSPVVNTAADDALALALADADSDSTLPNTDKLKAVERLIKEQLRLEDLKESLEEQVKQCNKDLERVQDKLLPDALQEAGCAAFTSNEGMTVKVESLYFAAVKKEDEGVFYDWLDSSGSGGIINTKVVIELGKGEHSLGKMLIKLFQDNLPSMQDEDGAKPLENLTLPLKLDEGVHWATLRAWAKEQTEAQNFIHPTAKIHNINRAKIKRPK